MILITEQLVEFIIQHPEEISDLPGNQLIEGLRQWRLHLLKQRMLLDINDKNILIVGDIHGDFKQMQRSYDFLINGDVDYLIFNGDIIDRGAEMIECIVSLMAFQLKYPEKVFFIRGNHEISSINEIYGFRGYATGLFGSKVYDEFTKAFQQLPIAAKIGKWGFVSHGGIPRDPIYFHLMRLEIKEAEPEVSNYAQLMWNDPDGHIKYFAPSIRGPGYFRFGKQVFREFMDFHELDYFFRAHQAFRRGYKWFFDNQLLSVFSSQAGPYYRISPHFIRLKGKSIELVKANDLD